MPRILLIDDDEHLAAPLASYFARFDCALDSADAARARASPSCAPAHYDAAILDVMLPEMDGFALCREIRKESDIPIVMLTARGEVMDRVVGLELGADDYLPKPFEPRELVARVQTILRRQRARAGAGARPTQRRVFEGLSIDLDKREVLRQGERVELTGTEFELLALLARRARQGLQPRRHPQPPARPRGRAVHARGRHRGEPAAQEAGAAGLHQDAAQRRLRAGRRQGRRGVRRRHAQRRAQLAPRAGAIRCGCA